MTRRRPQRRGILLLIVLSLLVLFVLIGITFVVTADRHARDSKIAARQERTGDDPVKELDSGLLRLLRGTPDPNSVASRHNLLRDLYGADGFQAMVASAVIADPSQQFVRINFADNAQVDAQSRRADYYAGGVLTMLDGFGSGRSTRIVRYVPPPAANQPGQLVVVAFDDLPPSYLPLPGERFLVNGKAFNGTGDGYNGTSGKADARQQPSNFELALLPFFMNRALLAHEDGDESWDAHDYQNVFLARIPTVMPPTGVASPNNPLLPSFHQPFLVNYWMQRLASGAVRWDSNGGSSQAIVDFLRRSTVARPLPTVHPFFSGSNPAFAPTVVGFTSLGLPQFDPDSDSDQDGVPNCMDSDSFGTTPGSSGADGRVDDLDNDGLADVPIVRGPWDVDNDNDGVADSVWIDLGDRVKTAPDGRMYKPLYAILCVDMDGRLNVNTHGTRQVLNTIQGTLVDYDGSATGSPGTQLAGVMVGQGYGPAEIRLDSALARMSRVPANGVALFSDILAQRYGVAETSPAPPSLSGLPGLPTVSSPLSYLHEWGIPFNYAAQTAENGSLCRTPLDPLGVRAVYTDLSGQPRFHYHQQPSYLVAGAPGSELIDDPYETNHGSPQADDALFSVEDLEQLNRAGDLDTLSFAGRLQTLFRTRLQTDFAPALMRRFTTHSFDVSSTPEMVFDSQERRQVFGGYTFPYVSVAGHVRARLARNGFGSSLTADQRNQQLEIQTRLMVPRELRSSQRMDLNRLFGNGKDDDGNGVVDEPAELLLAQPMWQHPAFPQFSTLLQSQGRFAMDDPHYAEDAPANNTTNGNFSRQVFARQLYCLAMLVMDNNFYVPSNVTAEADRRELTARRIAQWAVNVVDFRDPDAAMTPFEYDVNPFDENGWSVDDDFRTPDNTSGSSDRRIVWGMERPELLITESLAFHDRRVRDTKDDDDSDPAEGQAEGAELRLPDDNQDDNPLTQVAAPDQDLDQFRVPQGSLFLELYATGTPLQNNPAVPRELYETSEDAPQQGLDLGRIVDGSPVWRVQVTRAPMLGAPIDAWTQEQLALFGPTLLPLLPGGAATATDINDTGMLSPELRTTGVPVLSQPNYDRYILFTPVLPPNMPVGAYFYRRGGVAPIVRPGGYAIVGPRPATYLGSMDRQQANPPIAEQDPSRPSRQSLLLNPNALALNNLIQTDLNGNPIAPPAAFQPPVVIVAAANPPTTWTNAVRTAPTGIGVNVSEPLPTTSYYEEPRWGEPGPAPMSYYDDPGQPSPELQDRMPDEPLDHRPTAPLAQDPQAPGPTSRYLRTGTHLQFAMALLQRLADPTRRWDAVSNPYITVDTQTIDLTVFNGEEDNNPPAAWEGEDNPLRDEPYDIPNDPEQVPNPAPVEQFTARERGIAGQAAGGGLNVWSPLSTLPARSNRLATAEYWGHQPRHTLGRLNSTYGLPRAQQPMLGSPSTPFPWITWNDRPFASPMELLMVPTSAPWRLNHEVRPSTDSVYENFQAPMAYLLNFFYRGANQTDPKPNLARLLDLVETPSRFVGTRRWLNPRANLATQGPPDLREFAPPFNYVPEFREPGKINLNTIQDVEVGNALMGTETAAAMRRTTQSLFGGLPPAQRPAFVAQPFRSAASAELMPLPSLEVSPAGATLLRSLPNDQGNSPLLPAEGATNAYNNANVNPYFRYQPMMRLANLTTTHSNVFAVWITVGYFEVHPWNRNNPANFNLPPLPDPAHPDGYQLGMELGSDTGQVKRHRAFYLIDRSIPVGFEPGQNHNVEKTILLRRNLE